MICQFCQNDLYDDRNDVFIEYKQYHCFNCENKYSLMEVIFEGYKDNKFKYCVLSFYNENDFYDVTLFLNDNVTDVKINFKDAISLPGFPLTPSNIEEKLQLYLLFS